MSARTHLTFVFDDGELDDIAALRHRFDPEMARGVPPHVTLLYPEEHGGHLDELMERARVVAQSTGPFTLRCGHVVTDGDDGTGGVFVEVQDPSGTWSALRRALSGTPFTSHEGVAPHVTIVHPRTSDQGPAAWAQMQGRSFDSVLVADAFHLTVTDVASGMRRVERFELTGPGRALVAAVVLVDGDHVLMGKRRADRTWYPGAWDVIGGHVEAGETVAAAACRELQEEVGVSIQPGALRWLDTIVGDDFELTTYAATEWQGDVVNLAPDEHDEVGWHAVDTVAALDVVHPAIVDLCRAAVT